MKSVTAALTGLLLILSIHACQKHPPTAPGSAEQASTALPAAERVALALIQQSAWELDPDYVAQSAADAQLGKVAAQSLPAFKAEPISNDIVHFSFQIPIGPTAYDVVGVHRVVKVDPSGRPIRSSKCLFLQHGDGKDFTGMFLSGVRAAHVADDFGIAVYLAENKVDVWGIDQAWALVPEGVTDFGFMADWGMQRAIDDLRLAMQVAQETRYMTGCGLDKILFLGYSSGVLTGYALLDHETRLPKGQRVAKGFIPVDCPFKSNDAAFLESFGALYTTYKTNMTAGQLADPIPFKTLGFLARTDPEGASPLFEGFTNLQAALYFAAGPIFGPVPIHYFAGVWDNEMPVDLQYVGRAEFYDFFEDSPPVEAMLYTLEYLAIMSGLEESPFDDRLGAIDVPIFNVTAKGGLGLSTPYTLSLLGSTDVTNLVVQLHPDEEILQDFGHIDLFIAPMAQGLVWQPILRWVESHSAKHYFAGSRLPTF